MKLLKLFYCAFILLSFQSYSICLFNSNSKDIYSSILQLNKSTNENMSSMLSLIGKLESSNAFQLKMLSLIKDNIDKISQLNNSLGINVEKILDNLVSEIVPENLKFNVKKVKSDFHIVTAIQYDENSYIASFKDKQIKLINSYSHATIGQIESIGSSNISMLYSIYHNEIKMLLTYDTNSVNAYDWKSLKFLYTLNISKFSLKYFMNIDKNLILFSSYDHIFLYNLDKKEVVKEIKNFNINTISKYDENVLVTYLNQV